MCSIWVCVFFFCPLLVLNSIQYSAWFSISFSWFGCLLVYSLFCLNRCMARNKPKYVMSTWHSGTPQRIFRYVVFFSFFFFRQDTIHSKRFNLYSFSTQTENVKRIKCNKLCVDLRWSNDFEHDSKTHNIHKHTFKRLIWKKLSHFCFEIAYLSMRISLSIFFNHKSLKQ